MSIRSIVGSAIAAVFVDRLITTLRRDTFIRAALNGAMKGGWTCGGKPIDSLEGRVGVAIDIADEIMQQTER